MEIKRKLASIRKIDRIEPIPDADAIECAYVGGWPVVIRKNEYKVGDLAIYFEIDSWIPHVLAPFLSKGKEPRVYNGIKGERLRTLKLRGQVSQGLLLPVDWQDTQPFITANFLDDGIGIMMFVQEGDDVTDDLSVQKWEAPIPANLAGQVKGSFPSFIPKTDQERVQNLADKLIEHEDETFEVTVKMDGSSCTLYHYNGEVGVCSRNLELKINEENKDNSFVRLAQESRIFDFLPSLGNFAIQGELMGPGIQGNPENLKNHWLFIFDVFDIDNQRYLTSKERYEFCEQLSIRADMDMSDTILKNIDHVQKINSSFTIKSKTVEDLLRMAEGKSFINLKAEREGLVFKSNESNFTFKAISNKFLLQQKD